MPPRKVHASPADGTPIAKRYRGREVRGLIRLAPNNRVGLLLNGVEYSSLSAAARAVTGSKAVNGWKFWGLE